MKLEILIQAQGLIIPMHYNHMVQAALLNALKSDEYRQFIHDEGYHYEKRSYKPFTFSTLMGKTKKIKDEKKIQFIDNMRLIVSSSQKEFIAELKDGLEEKGLRLGNQQLNIQRVIVDEELLVGSYLKVESLSPVVAYSTVIEGEKKRTQYFSPLDKAFSQILRENIIKKYKAIYGESTLEEDSFEVIPIATEKYIKSVVYYKNFIINGYNGKFILLGNPTLIQLALESGLGGKNAQGFGCIRAIK